MTRLSNVLFWLTMHAPIYSDYVWSCPKGTSFWTYLRKLFIKL